MSELLNENKSQIEQQQDEINDLNHQLDQCSKEFQKITEQLEQKSSCVDKLNTQISEHENEILRLKKLSMESMKRDNLAMKSKQREKDTQIKDLQEKVIQMEHENDQLKETNKTLKKQSKEIKQDCDLKNKQSFRIVQSERDELEEKLRNEIQQRVSAYLSLKYCYSNKKRKDGLMIGNILMESLKI